MPLLARACSGSDPPAARGKKITRARRPWARRRSSSPAPPPRAAPSGVSVGTAAHIPASRLPPERLDQLFAPARRPPRPPRRARSHHSPASGVRTSSTTGLHAQQLHRHRSPIMAGAGRLDTRRYRERPPAGAGADVAQPVHHGLARKRSGNAGGLPRAYRQARAGRRAPMSACSPIREPRRRGGVRRRAPRRVRLRRGRGPPPACDALRSARPHRARAPAQLARARGLLLVVVLLLLVPSLAFPAPAQSLRRPGALPARAPPAGSA